MGKIPVEVRRTGAVAAVLLAGSFIGAAFWAWRYHASGLDALFGLASAATGLCGLWLAWSTFRSTQISDSAELDLTVVADRLAIAIKYQWEQEMASRRLNDPYPLPVRWHSADPDLVEPWQSLIHQADTWTGGPLLASPGSRAAGARGLDGSGKLADVLAKVPTGRLVVLGAPGAGKTMLLGQLLLDLIARRSPGGPVPVLLPVASWDPVAEGLYAWLERRLAVDYPGLSEPGPAGTRMSRVEGLLADRLIVLLLDGLDEINEKTRGQAIARINNALQPGQWMVLASRTDPFRAAVRPLRGIEIRVRGAAGVKLCPLDTSAVVQYLRDSADGVTAAARWEPVLSALGGSNASPLAQALRTPLMASLARSIYTPQPGDLPAAPPHDPAELLQYRTGAEIEEHLFDAFVPAAYRPGRRSGSSYDWTADKAEQWLIFLARDLQRRQGGTTDLSWWELPGAAPRPLAGICAGLAAGTAGAAGLPIGAGVGLALLTADAVGLVVRRWSRRTAGLAPGLAGGLIGGIGGSLLGQAVSGTASRTGSVLAAGLAAGLASGSLGGFRAGLAGGFAGGFVASHVLDPDIGSLDRLINGLGLGFAALCTVSLAQRQMPARRLRWSPLGSVVGLGAGVILGFALWLQVGLTGGIAAGLVTAVTGGFAAGLEVAPADLTAAVSPQIVLVRDRATFWITGLAWAAAIGLITGLAVGLPSGFPLGLAVGLANGITVGLAVGFLQAEYAQFILARCWFAIHGRLPWRLMAFLADAHQERGVLRQVGATYQFKHEKLQSRLADRP